MKRILLVSCFFVSMVCHAQLMVQATNWKRIPIPINATHKLYFWSADSGFAYVNNHEVKLLRTYDGGMTWKTVFDITQYTDSNKVYKCPIHIRDKNNVGLAFWDKDSFINFIKTKDGGNTWEKHKSSDKIVTRCYDIMYNGDTIAIASTPEMSNGLALYTCIQYSSNNLDSVINVPFKNLIKFRPIDNHNFYLINANARMQGDGSNFISMYGSLRFGFDINADKLDTTLYNLGNIEISDYRFFPDYKNIDHGYTVSPVGRLLRYPVNNISSDSFFSTANFFRGEENIYENFCAYRFWRGYCLDSNKLVVAAGKNVYAVNGALFTGGHLSIVSQNDNTTCIYYGDSTTGYIGTNNSYLFKSTEGVLLAGINNSLNSKVQFKVYPNPAINKLHIEFAEEGEYIYTLCNPLGQIILEGNCNNKTAIDLEEISKGMYFLNVYDTQNRQAVQKIIVR